MIAAGAAGSAMGGASGMGGLSGGANLFGGSGGLANLFTALQGMMGGQSGGTGSLVPAVSTGSPKTDMADATSEVPKSGSTGGSNGNNEKMAAFLAALNSLTRPNSMADPKSPSVVVLPAYQGSAFLGRM